MTDVTPELLVEGLSPSRGAISPDGRWVAYGVGRVVAGPPHGVLWVAPAQGDGVARALTDGTRRVSVPRWTDDSAALVLLVDGRPTRLDVTDGTARELTAWDGEVFDQLPLGDGESLALVALEAEADGVSDVVVLGTESGDGLWLLAAGAKEPRRVAGLGERHVVAVGGRPDGGAVAVVSWEVPRDDPGAFTARLHVVDTATGAVRDLGPAALDAGSPVWWHDGGAWHVAYLGVTPPHVVGGTAVLDVTVPRDGEPAGEHRNLTAGLETCPLELAQVAQGAPLALFADGLDTALHRLDPATGRFERLALVEGLATDLTADRTGAAVALRIATADRPIDVHAGPVRGPFRQVSDTRPHYRDVLWGTRERLSVTAGDGLALDGILVLPPGRTRVDGPFPLLTLAHGGPYGRYADGFHFNFYLSAQWFAAAGHAVLLPNPRGSQGRGHAFAATVAGAVGGEEWTDVLAFVDRLVADGTADPGRLSIAGWSHGGYLAAWAVTRTDRFKAAVVGAGIADWGLQVTGEFGRQEAALSGSAGWEGHGPHPHDAVSPISYAASIRTPVLILHGEEDTNVPVAQATYLHRALTRYGVPHEVALYPDEGHAFSRRDHQVDAMLRTRGFLDRYVG